jgi:hypothetical protein
MTHTELARYLGKVQEARTDAELLAIELDLRAHAPARERDALLRILARLRQRDAHRD